MESTKLKGVLGILRISMGFIFLWAFFDKLLGLGYATTPEKSWLAGGSPTSGFLQFGVHGPFADFYHSLVGNGMVDWLFMLGLLGVGLSLAFGIFMKLGGMSGVMMMLLMYLAVGIQPANNPLIDDHIIYLLVIMVLVMTDSGTYIGLGNRWKYSRLVQKYKILR
ncbi:MAG: hypothetical protein WC783_02775 [Candidatus Paceibacterota bacterium]|jgi:thiosulfate dehydrogenase [quinone] large subunit